jgi:signal transduction histidine kinase
VDEGSGVPVEAHERIFEPFSRERWVGMAAVSASTWFA